MSARRTAALGLAWAAACGSFVEVDDAGVVALEVFPPVRTQLENGESVAMHARAVDGQGDSVAVELLFLTPDTTLLVDPVSGVVTGRTGSGSGRVQVVYEGTRRTIHSDFITFSLQPRADTLIRVSPDTQTVLLAATASQPLVARLESFDPPGPLAGRRIIFTVVEPAFADPALRTVELPGGRLGDTLSTSATGSPATSPTLNRVPGVVAPDSAIVEISAFQATGSAVPGTGQRFIVRFQNP